MKKEEIQGERERDAFLAAQEEKQKAQLAAQIAAAQREIIEWDIKIMDLVVD